MVIRTGKEVVLPYAPEDPVKAEYLPYLLEDIGISQTLMQGFAKSPQEWLAANATKDFIYQFYNYIETGNLSPSTTMSELQNIANMFYTGYEVAQHDVSQIFKIPDTSALKD